MSRLNFVTSLITDWGSWPCPPDLIKLYDAAPKRMLCYTSDEDGGARGRMIPDESTAAGSVYYARERELIKAIDTIEATENLCVSVRNP